MLAFTSEFLGGAASRGRFADVQPAQLWKSCLQDVYERPLARDRLAAITQYLIPLPRACKDRASLTDRASAQNGSS